jgi:hypothetical protein
VRWPALATLIMAGAVLAVKFALLGNVHPSVLLVAEILTGFVTFELALFILERSLFIEVLTVALQALPGGVRVGRLLHLSITPRTFARRGRGRRRAALEEQASAAEVALEEEGLGLVGDQLAADPTLGHDADV